MKWPSWLRGKLSATPGTAVTGYDKGAVIRSVARQMLDKAEAGRKKLEEEGRKWKYEERESLVVIASRHEGDPRVRGRAYYTLTSATPITGDIHATARAFTIPDAECDLLFHLAQIYAEQGLVKDFDEARERASKVQLFVETSMALGSKGFAS